jgi:hypothetical protein
VSIGPQCPYCCGLWLAISSSLCYNGVWVVASVKAVLQNGAHTRFSNRQGIGESLQYPVYVQGLDYP